MSETLSTIRKMIQEVKTTLDQCTPKSFKQADVDAAAQERMLLKEKLNMLETAEQKEVDAIAMAEADELHARKVALLEGIAKESTKQQKAFNSLNAKLNKILLELVNLLEERSQLFYPSSFGLNKLENKQLLSQSDIDMLGSALKSLRSGNSGTEFEASFSQAFRHATDQLPNESTVRSGLNSVVRATWGAKPYQSIEQSIPEVCEAILNPIDTPDELDAEY